MFEIESCWLGRLLLGRWVGGRLVGGRLISGWWSVGQWSVGRWSVDLIKPPSDTACPMYIATGASLVSLW